MRYGSARVMVATWREGEWRTSEEILTVLTDIITALANRLEVPDGSSFVQEIDEVPFEK